MALALGGCLFDHAKGMADYQNEASRFYRTYHAISPDDPSSRFIIVCMAAKGYDFTITSTQCSSEYPLPPKAACYEPTNWVFWVIEKFRAD
jgi:hypothetical protein